MARTIAIRLRDDLYDHLQRLAAANFRSMSAQVALLIEQDRQEAALRVNPPGQVTAETLTLRAAMQPKAKDNRS